MTLTTKCSLVEKSYNKTVIDTILVDIRIYLPLSDIHLGLAA